MPRNAAGWVRSDRIHGVFSASRTIAPSINYVRGDILNVYGRTRLEISFLCQQLLRSCDPMQIVDTDISRFNPAHYPVTDRSCAKPADDDRRAQNDNDPFGPVILNPSSHRRQIHNEPQKSKPQSTESQSPQAAPWSLPRANLSKCSHCCSPTAVERAADGTSAE